MVSVQVLTQQHFALNVWLITGIAIMLIRDGSVNGQLSNGRGAADYGAGNGNSPSGGAGGEGGNNGEVLLSKTSPLNGQEPTCEELRAMWRFSKRQSRAAEVTNEIPTYRDPFAYNIWEPYIATTRSIGGVRISPRYRDSARPVYGRILHREPLATLVDRNRGPIEDYPRGSSTGYGLIDGGGGSSRIQSAAASAEPRRRIQFRFAGYGPGGSNTQSTQNLLTAHHGSFQKLKELIWTERARELATQRKAEELAARAAVLKDIANGQNFALRRQLQQQQQHAGGLADENRNPDTDHSSGVGTVVSLPGAQKSSSLNAASGKQQSLGHGVSSNIAGSLRSGGVHFPLGSGVPSPHTIGQLRTYVHRQPGASIFRERNRALYRQSLASQPLPADYYQRDLRKAADSDDDSSSISSSNSDDIDMSSSTDDLIDNFMLYDSVDDNTQSSVDRNMSIMPFSRNIATDDILSAMATTRRQNQHNRKQQQQTAPLNIRDFLQSYYEQMNNLAEQQGGGSDVSGRFMNLYF